MEHEKQIEVRWRDLDSYGHVNNVVFLTYLEEARDEWLARSLGTAGTIWDYVVARVAIDYRREVLLEDDVVIAKCKLGGLGNSSVRTVEQVVMRDGQIAAEAEVVLVARDRESGKSRPLTPEERAAFDGD
jgi:acyl-CoA thioester hydrolase